MNGHDTAASFSSTDVSPSAPGARRASPSPTVLAVAALLSFAAARLSNSVVDLDVYHQMALARESLAAGHLLTHDVWSFTALATPMVHHEWGHGVILYAIAHTFGGTGLLVLRAALVALTICVATWTALRLGAALPTTLGVGFLSAILLELAGRPTRAQLWSLLFTALLIHLIERHRAGQAAALLLLLPLLSLWVNLHGGFPLGLLMLAAYTCELLLAHDRRWWQVVAILLLSPLPLALNPYGFAYHRHLVQALLFDRHGIPEWLPIWAAYGGVWLPHFVDLAILHSYASARGRHPQRNRGLLLIVLTALLTLRALRIAPFFALASLSYLPAALRESRLDAAAAHLFKSRVTLVISAAVVAASTGWMATHAWWTLRVPNDPPPHSQVAYPVGPVNFLRQAAFSGRLLTSFASGSYVMWKLYPSVTVSLDSRYEAAYSSDVAQEIMALYESGSGFGDVVSRHHPTAALVRRDSPLALRITWPLVYEDATWQVYLAPGITLPFVSHTTSTVDAFP